MSDYIPLPGDLVQFPGAPLSVNRTRRYEIISVAGGLVTFRIGAQEFTKNLSQLQDIGIAQSRALDRRPYLGWAIRGE